MKWRTRADIAELLALLVFAVVFIGLEINSYTRTAATWDEPGHLVAGYVALARHDYRVDPEHPPFLRMWAASPLLLMTPPVTLDTGVLDRTEPNEWALVTLFDFTHRVLYQDNDADRLLYAGRFMMVLLGLLLGILLFRLVRDWFGRAAAITVLVLYTIEPNVSAHAPLVTTDAGLACFVVATVYFLWRTIHRRTVSNVVGLMLSCALTAVSKFSGVLIGPVIIVLLAGSVIWFRTLSWRTATVLMALLTASSYAGIWAVYGFRYAPSDSPTWLFHLHDNHVVLQRVPTLAFIVRWIDARHLLPNAYSEGFLLGQAKAQTRDAFLAGSYSQTGWWYYFPVAVFLKTPVAMILAAAAGAWLLVCGGQSAQRERAAFLIVPMTIFLGAAMTSASDLGVRYVLPIFPFMLILASAAVRRLLMTAQARERLVLVVLLLAWAGEFARAYPFTLGFFNQLVGGPAYGYEYLADSNLDWGQDLKPLKTWMDQQGVSRINLAYFGSADPAYYGIECAYLPPRPDFAPPASDPPQWPSYVAVSATILDDVYGDRHNFYQPLRERDPVAHIGSSMFVYWVDAPWWTSSTTARFQ